MSSRPSAAPAAMSFLQAFQVQCRVIGALLMREMHTRYGRENIGYLWLFGEPMMLATVIGSLHTSGHTAYGNDIHPLPFAIVGYTIFIMFRGIVNRSEGGLEVNAPLLYHRMVTALDIVYARALLEAAGTVTTYAVMIALLAAAGLGALPVRPLYVAAALFYMFWISMAHSLIVTAISHDNRTVGRLVHPYTYFMIPLSGAFTQVEWLPEPYRTYFTYLPLPHIFEIARYGQFRSATLDYVDFQYITAFCMVLTYIGMVGMKLVRRKIHLN
jgi:capsular polysaccharide transport system permease protein